jgi:hypothetical protein
VRVLFRSGDPKVPMENRERTCMFHSKMALERHMKQLIKPELQAKHIRLCQEYHKCQTIGEADSKMASIKAWWFSSGAVSESGLIELNNWIGFWHFRYQQWGSHISQVSRGSLFCAKQAFSSHYYCPLL